MTFTPESKAQLDAAGKALYGMIDGLGNGFNYEDVQAAFGAAMASKEVVDEIKADKARALACIVAAALGSFGTS